jgi:3-oxoacyl-[acyl-carrier protein] reductase
VGSLDGRVALVTGSSRGLGAGIARAFGREGASVAVNYRSSEDKANQVVRDIEALGSRAIAVQADCTDEQSVNRMVEQISDELGPVRILVNNAGDISMSPFDEMSLEMWEEMIASHLRSHFLVTHACIPGMKSLKPLNGERRKAKVINMSSGIGQKGGPGGAGIVHYVTVKAGVLGFTKALAGEFAPDITVNAISPGTHPTDIILDLSEEWREAKQEELLLGFGTIEDVAETAVFVASPAADYYTGQTLMPNGGDVMNG